MITFQNRQHQTLGDLIVALIGNGQLLVVFNTHLEIVNVTEADMTLGGAATSTLDERSFDFLVRECMNIIKINTDTQRPRPRLPTGRGLRAATNQH